MFIRSLVILLALISCARADPVALGDIRVKDGDTIYYRATQYRMVGYDAPETNRVRWRPVSKDEMALGALSKARLQDLLTTGPIDLSPVPCSCSEKAIKDGTCNHGRLCAVLSVSGENVGKALIAEELAVPFVCGPTRCPRMPDWQKIIDTQFPH